MKTVPSQGWNILRYFFRKRRITVQMPESLVPELISHLNRMHHITVQEGTAATVSRDLYYVKSNTKLKFINVPWHMVLDIKDLCTEIRIPESSITVEIQL